MKMKLLSISIIVSSLVIGCTNDSPMSSTQTATPSKATVEAAVSQDITLGAGEDAYVDNESVIDESKSGSTDEGTVASSVSNTNIAFKDVSSTGKEGTYIKDIRIVASSTDKDVSCDDGFDVKGYTKLDIDLNEGAGGDWVYLCYTKTDDIDRVLVKSIKIGVVSTSTNQGLTRTIANYSPVKYVRDGVQGPHNHNYDVNPGVKYFQFLQTSSTIGTGLKDLAIISTGNTYSKSSIVEEYINAGWNIAQSELDDRWDLNWWAGGRYIYIVAK